MPTLETTLRDLEHLTGRTLPVDNLDLLLDWVKGEVKGFDPKTGALKIELNDTNRPDLWTVEGIARQLKGGKSPSGRAWENILAREKESGFSPEIRVNPTVSGIRPVIGGFIARGPALGDDGLAQLIQTQERLSEIYGRKRADVAIGIYPLKTLHFPLLYEAVSPDSVSFVPLGFDASLSLRDILEHHPKGKTYKSLLSSREAYPLLRNEDGTVLSFPPIINARHTGEVTAPDSELFVEATGFDQGRVTLVLNILAANLFDRGFTLTPVTVRENGKSIRYPQLRGPDILVPADLPVRVTGEDIDPEIFRQKLLDYGYDAVEVQPDGYLVRAPFYRDDILHPVDCVEDFLISRGYDSFAPTLPSSFTVGKEDPARAPEETVRRLMTGLGFQEILSNILTSIEKNTTDLGRPSDTTVEIDNPVSRQYGVVRSTLLPFLLSSETQSSRFPYPHRLFEVGEVLEKTTGGSSVVREKMLFSGLLSHPQASLSELAGMVFEVLRHMGVEPALSALETAPYISGRSGALQLSGHSQPVGEIGEVHPEWLERWGIRMPTVLFEIELSKIYPGLYEKKK
ncbi:phenylalanine--tRNA ligase subunit beta [Leptospirillum ferriphilum]|uniref:phenylalanine--tRNA ligase n=1 Tax=Leptospirillum ferriphilum TaxID=178606 RepID=A0A1V3SVI0_9BACT|nr:phenylalanine--tRNA ligase subunit beta [Leptospirillum ferriphilum]OOH71928.1 phenylalanine--tRNA ligase subunit beta [Leptospirillum ferriphilum]